MIDLRYLALSLIGVFLALAVGLMMGSALGTPDKRDQAYEGLRGQFELLRADIEQVRQENDAARRRLEAADQALQELLPQAVQGRLSGTTVGVVLCGPLNENPFWSELERALRLAGASPGPILRVPDRLRPLTPELRARMRRSWGGDGREEEGDDFAAARWMARALGRGAPPARIEEVARQSGMELRGELAVPLRHVLVLTPPADEPRAEEVAAGAVPEVPFVEAARREGVRVVVGEPDAALRGSLNALRRFRVPTVDHVDTAAGQISVVLALSGSDGDFGTKPGASRAIPALRAP